jgi:hypothetical protein
MYSKRAGENFINMYIASKGIILYSKILLFNDGGCPIT